MDGVSDELEAERAESKLRRIFDEVGNACATVEADANAHGLTGQMLGARDCLRRIAAIRDKELATPMPSQADEKALAIESGFTNVNCTRCGALRLARKGGSPGACSFVPSGNMPGCPSPLYDVEREAGSKSSPSSCQSSDDGRATRALTEALCELPAYLRPAVPSEEDAARDVIALLIADVRRETIEGCIAECKAEIGTYDSGTDPRFARGIEHAIVRLAALFTSDGKEKKP